jgi:hypothetical protein
MNPSRTQTSQTPPTYEQIDQAIRTLDLHPVQARTILAPRITPGDRLQQVLKIYKGIKPLLTAVSMLPVIPETWRAAALLLVQSLDALAAVVPAGATVEFKAGKDFKSDLEQE